jgi:hypothetical protein
MKLLIAISSCWDFEKNGNNAALRGTWLPDIQHFSGLDYKFFVGHGQGAESAELPDDCIFLPDVDDGYGFLTYKTRSSLRWAYERGYEFVFRCFPDCFVRVDRLMACGFEQHDFFGDFRSEGDAHIGKGTEPSRPILQQAQNYASGGAGYWLSRRAFELLLQAPITGIWRDTITPYAEDLWVGNRLGVAQQPLRYFDEKRFCNHGSRYWPRPDNDTITAHMSCPDYPYDKARMYAAHALWQSK